MDLDGWKEIHTTVCEHLKKPVSPETVRKWKWLNPALRAFNGRIWANKAMVQELLTARFQPRATA